MDSAWTQPQVLAAFITGLVSLMVALWTYFSSKSNQRDLEILKGELAREKSENDARRAYEFEARKRLYQEYEPLLFQLNETADNAYYRIQSLARSARLGRLNANEGGWLSQYHYYAKSTLYKLFAPLAVFQMMKMKLTFVDINVDESIGVRYQLVKQLYLTYTDDFEFARLFKTLDYDPNIKAWQVLRKIQPQRYWRQGLPMGLLDQTIDLMIDSNNNSNQRLITFGEFDKMYGNLQNERSADLGPAWDIFHTFHPSERPVLWRVLICQAAIFRAIIRLNSTDSRKITVKLVHNILFEDIEKDVVKFKWSDKVSIEEVYEPFEVAKKYLKNKLQGGT
jgi:hypothetical protein